MPSWVAHCTADALTHLVSDVGSIFTFSMENGLISFITHGMPHIQRVEANAKKVWCSSMSSYLQALENELKLSCTRFIESTVKALFGPLMSFLNQVKAYLDITETPNLKGQRFATAGNKNRPLHALMPF